MRLAIFLVGFLVGAGAAPALAPSCTDFSGRFLGVDADSDFLLVLKQTACQGIEGELTYLDSGLSFRKDMVFDDVFHVTWETDTVVNLEKHRIDGGILSYEVLHRFKSDGRAYRTVGSYVLDAAGDLLEKQSVYDPEGALVGQFTHRHERRH